MHAHFEKISKLLWRCLENRWTGPRGARAGGILFSEGMDVKGMVEFSERECVEKGIHSGDGGSLVRQHLDHDRKWSQPKRDRKVEESSECNVTETEFSDFSRGSEVV